MPDPLGSVAEVWRYPVKSLRGERLDGAACSARGIDQDRRGAVLGADGRIGSGKTTRRSDACPACWTWLPSGFPAAPSDI